ncbi:MAG: peptidoglycan DD-metalloendopeptidase family protein [Solirubrobacteraceae bacterium]|nr:peptidoglycan DD-metalloendopeptidase family protein [Solirubrobacteraceae bacterium]
MRRRLTIIAGLVGTCLLLWGSLPLMSSAAPSAEELAKKIQKTQGKVEFRKGKEKVLTRDIAGYSSKISALQSRLNKLQSRENTLNGDLEAKRAALGKTQGELRSERARLARLQRRLREVRATLSARLVQLYKEGRPDLASVVLEADGFANLIERGEYVGRLAAKDRQIIGIVADARSDATTTERKLAAIEKRQRTVAAAITARRNDVMRVRQTVSATDNSLRTARNSKRALLTSVKGSRKELEEDLAQMQEQQARISGILSGSAGDAPVKRGNGRFVWPVQGTLTSPFCESRSWESCHPGIDIAVPTGTPVHAADSGRVAIAGWVGGYGNYICIQHTAALSTCYGHNSKLLVSVGQTVSQGQTIAASGSTGHSTGPHVHFEVRLNGAVQNPMNYL